MPDTPAPTMPSATAVVLRNGRDGIETLLIQRNENMSAYAGSWVFPGGKIDEVDYEGLDGSEPLAVARNAAVRETLEETGLAIDAGSMLAFSHWTTPEAIPKRFATWFFLAPTKGDAQVRLDASESQSFGWFSPGAALREHESGSLKMAVATLVTLHQIAQYRSCLELELHCHQADLNYYMPRTVKQLEEQYLLLNDDAGYETWNIREVGKKHRVIRCNNRLNYICSVQG